MKHGFLKVSAVTTDIKVADVDFNAQKVIEGILFAYQGGARIIVLPELVLSGYTCQDLFLQETLLNGCKRALTKICENLKGVRALVFVGLPFEVNGKLYNVAAAIYEGRVLGFVPKKYLPNYGEFYEARHFEKAPSKVFYIDYEGKSVPFGTNIIFTNSNERMPLRVACEICEDLWTADPPSTGHAIAGANVIVNLSASNEVVCKESYRRQLVAMTSARLVSAYIYASAGEGESTQDLVFSGHNIIAENGSIISESSLFENSAIYGDIDINRLNSERRRMTTYNTSRADDYIYVPFELDMEDTALSRSFSKTPFVPLDEKGRRERCEEILSIQALGLKKRLSHTGCKNAVVGLSGGLDSTLALLVMARAYDMLSLDRSGIQCITMPCFGTTDRTYDNACNLARTIGATLTEVKLMDAVRLHFRDIGQDESVHDVTYENGQARERTQVLMDIANKLGGMVIGTGDMSELALGWATYNGDHMSMYGVNASVPKTLVRHLVRYYADTCNDEELSRVLLDVLDTPVSPELLPPKDGKISQKTEDLVGPYELHDFFMYYVLRFGYSPSKIFRIAMKSFAGEYDRNIILKWEKTFFRRFFSQQFKRSCLPDGPKVGSVAVSPRGDLRMPSDAMASLWLEELEKIQ